MRPILDYVCCVLIPSVLFLALLFCFLSVCRLSCLWHDSYTFATWQELNSTGRQCVGSFLFSSLQFCSSPVFSHSFALAHNAFGHLLPSRAPLLLGSTSLHATANVRKTEEMERRKAKAKQYIRCKQQWVSFYFATFNNISFFSFRL